MPTLARSAGWPHCQPASASASPGPGRQRAAAGQLSAPKPQMLSGRSLLVTLGVGLLQPTSSGAAFAAAPLASGGLVYPLYVYPTKAAVAGVYRNVVKAAAITPLTVIVNPDNGDQAACPPNTDWAAAIEVLRHPNVTTLGYVHSSYGKRPLAEYRREIAAYTSCWGVGGIFVDEAASATSAIPYYKSVAQTVHSFQKNATVWLNPGTATDHGYLSIADVLVQFESPAKAFGTYTPPSYLNGTADPSRCSMMVLDVDSGDNGMRAAVAKIQSFGCGWVLVLDRTTSYTTDHVPTFWQDEAEAVAHAHAHPR